MESIADRESLISTRIQMLADIFNRKITDGMVAVYQRILRGFPIFVLSKAFTEAESTLEKFPTPRILAGMCGAVMPSQMWRYSFRADQAPDPETGMFVDVLIDPDPLCDSCRNPQSEHPTKTCREFIDKLFSFALYRPQDCPEGRMFLARLKEIAEHKAIPLVDLEASRANLQAQKVAILERLWD